MTNAMKTKAFAYYRTSSASNVGDDKDTRERQKSAVETYAYVNGIEIVGEFYDAAVKGADVITERKAFAEMLEAIAGNGVRLVLVETANRFARDLIVQETGWRFLKEQGIDLIAVDSPTSFLDDTPTAVLIRQILGAVAQFEKAALVARLSAARRRLGRPGGQKGLSELRPEVVERARSLRFAYPDMTLRALAEALALEGYVTSSGKVYGPSTVANMLR
jgi:DNA invertase Pin-like site-specific DNA recombinase